VTPSPTITATYTPQAPYRVKLVVYNGAGEEVGVISEGLASYTEPTGLGGVQANFVPDTGGVGTFVILSGSSQPTTFVWDGTSSSGQTVASGTYLVQATVNDAFGHVTTYTTTATVVRVDLDVKVEIYNSAGELVKHFEAPASTAGASGVSLNQTTVSSGSTLSINYGGGSLPWDTTNDSGSAVASGQYLVKVTRVTGKGEVQVFTQSVTVLNGPTSLLDGAACLPNPAAASDAFLTILLPSGTLSTTEVHAVVFNLAGEKVASLSNQGKASIRWDFGPSLSPGVYVIHLSARDAKGNRAVRTLKAAILR
jgi:flagellar hook assembly protein FlgD